jgi:hypothetical protein
MVFMYMGLFHAFADVPDTVQAVPISRLVDQSYAFDGRTVTIEGEVIGDIMKRGNHVWVTVLDGGIAVGVWVDNSSLRVKLTAGRYELEGDRVRATGVMYRACKEHGGDLDIHGESIELLAEGHPTGHPVSWIRKLAALLLCGAGLVFALMWRLRKRGTATA